AAFAALRQNWCTERRYGQIRLAHSRQCRRRVEVDIRASRPTLPRADAGDVLRRDARGSMRYGAVRNGPVLLPERSEGLSRYFVLPRSRTSFQRLRLRFARLPVRAGLCDRARGRAPRAEPA